MLWIRRFLSVCHLALGMVLLLGVLSYIVLGVHGLPQLMMDAHGKNLPGTFLLVALVILLPEMAFGVWMLTLARWLWSGHRRLRNLLLVTHGFMLVIGVFAIKLGFDVIDAAEHSTAQGGGLLSPFAYFPFVIGVPVLVFAFCSIAVALWAVPRQATGTMMTNSVFRIFKK
jgi:hypothetical protein